MERLANETLPNGIGYEWTELTYQQKLAGNTPSWFSRSAFCSYSWFSPRSTRAGRCRS